MFLRTEETAYQDLIAMNDVYTHDVRDTLRSEMARPISDVMRSNTQHWAPGDQGQCRGQLLEVAEPLQRLLRLLDELRVLLEVPDGLLPPDDVLPPEEDVWS